MGVLEEAIQYATELHEGMVRKSEGIPYILHPLEVAAIAGTMTHDTDVLIAALLHDTVEDTPASLEDIEARFGSRVAELVASETEDKRANLPPTDTWRIRKEESLVELAEGDRDVHILWLSDKLSNMRSFYRGYSRRGKSLWEDFNQKDPVQHAWYYQEIARLTSDLREEAAWQEYTRLMGEIFEEELA
ncbi:MAG: bifunctional (p)ppGpp synthetase/guanosine-3',5'-bis(diphosphate) 3'-pyrophosphohydrolase [Atopobiaceae bacterium]|nr:bifunctional (p)ppGpp synthetase/guanosine-3',5'-bis(diphosphate) 3'-pyrophosphohydrolase [Atopobiaceae bacterium]